MQPPLLKLAALACLAAPALAAPGIKIPTLGEIDTSGFTPELRAAILEPNVALPKYRALLLNPRTKTSEPPYVPLHSGNYVVGPPPVSVHQRMAIDAPEDAEFLANRNKALIASYQARKGSIYEMADGYFPNKGMMSLNKHKGFGVAMLPKKQVAAINAARDKDREVLRDELKKDFIAGASSSKPPRPPKGAKKGGEE